MLIEGLDVRASTGVPKRGGSPAQNKELRRQAEEIYAARKAAAAREVARASVEKPAITFRDFARWYETHVAAHRCSDDSTVAEESNGRGSPAPARKRRIRPVQPLVGLSGRD